MNFMTQLLTTPIHYQPLWLILFTLIYFILSYSLSATNFLMRLMKSFPTLLHEFGHAFMCLLTGGKVKDIVIVFSHREQVATQRLGYAETLMTGKFNQFATMIAGYLFSPLFLLLGYYALIHQLTTIYLVLLILVFLFYFIKTSRKLFPGLLIVLTIAAIYFITQHPNQNYSAIFIYGYHFLLATLLADTILTSLMIIRVYLSHNQTWDGALLKQVTKIPAFIYATLFISVNLYTCYIIIKPIIRTWL